MMSKIKPEYTIKLRPGKDTYIPNMEDILKEQYRRYVCNTIKLISIEKHILDICSQCKKENENCHICGYNHILKTTNAEVKFAN